MKITAVHCWKENLELSRPYTVAFQTFDKVENFFVVLETEKGLWGIGSGSPSAYVTGENLAESFSKMKDFAESFLPGKDIRQYQWLLAQLKQHLPTYPAARTAIDIALHDLFAKYLELPLIDLWGRAYSGLPTSITIGIKSMTETLAEAKEYVDFGFKIIKLKIGNNLEEDIAIFSKLREQVGPNIKIRVDANQGYNVADLQLFAKKTKALDVEFYEQPFPPKQLEMMHQLPEAIRKVCAADEDLHDAVDAMKLAQLPHAYGIYNVKLMKCGGVQEALKIADIAQRHGIDLMWGCNDESIISITAALHVALSNPATRYLDLDGSFDLARDVVDGGFELKDGVLYPGEGVGLGLKELKGFKGLKGVKELKKEGETKGAKLKAIVITNGLLDINLAKTCHGLLRGSDRFEVLAVIDYKFVGQDAGEVMDGKALGIPIYSSVDSYFENKGGQPDCCVVGVAFPGGKLPDNFRGQIESAIRSKLSVYCGLHQFLSEDPVFSALAAKHQVDLIDVRKPKLRSELKFWSGDIFSVKATCIAVLGTDCAIGKRTTTKWLMEMCRSNGLKGEMIYTGQTGWMQGIKHGFILDSTINDFITGELEKAILACDKETQPDFIFIEGQSALRNPTGPCGSEILLSANAKGVVLQHAPGRDYYEGTEHFEYQIPDVESEVELIKLYGSEVLAITLSEEHINEEDIQAYQKALSSRVNIPIIRPLKEGVAALLPVLKSFMSRI